MKNALKKLTNKQVDVLFAKHPDLGLPYFPQKNVYYYVDLKKCKHYVIEYKIDKVQYFCDTEELNEDIWYKVVLIPNNNPIKGNFHFTLLPKPGVVKYRRTSINLAML